MEERIEITCGSRGGGKKEEEMTNWSPHNVEGKSTPSPLMEKTGNCSYY